MNLEIPVDHLDRYTPHFSLSPHRSTPARNKRMAQKNMIAL